MEQVPELSLQAMFVEVHVGDVVQLRKPHPCGSDVWLVTRVGADIGLVCQRCKRRVMLPRGTFNKRLKTISSRGSSNDGV